MADWFFNPRYPRVLLALFALYWLAWALRPLDRAGWLLENVLLTLFVAGLILTHRRFPLSNVSYTLIFIFVCLHTIGAHYTYSKVPYDDWFRALSGWGLNELLGFERNHYDRLVHFSFGLLLAYPIREVFLRVAGARGFWGYYLPLDVTMSFSMLFELVEWAAAVVFGGELGQAYLGTQGDVWDAHKDMTLASLGAVISMGVVAAINRKYNRRFGEEWRKSLAVKGKPLGEVKLRELLEEDKNKK
jgi:putative membrane protein